MLRVYIQELVSLQEVCQKSMFQSRATRSWTRSFLKQQIARQQSLERTELRARLFNSVHCRQRGNGVKVVACTARASRRHIWKCNKFIGVAKLREGRKQGEKATEGRNQSWSQRKRAKARVYERMNARHKWRWGAIIGMPVKEKKTTEPEQKVGECSTLVKSFLTTSAMSCIVLTKMTGFPLAAENSLKKANHLQLPIAVWPTVSLFKHSTN